MKPSNGVIVIVTTPLVVEFRSAIYHEYYPDEPTDEFTRLRVQLIMSETIMNCIEQNDDSPSHLEAMAFGILEFLKQHVIVLKIKEIYFLDHDSIFIHC